MKYRLLDFLRCIECGGILNCIPQEKSKNEYSDSLKLNGLAGCQHFCAFDLVEEEVLPASPTKCARCYTIEIEMGTLTCQECGAPYPITGGIPRMLPPQLSAENSKQDKSLEAESLAARKRTQKSFGFEWQTFSDMRKEWKENFLLYLGMLADSGFFEGKTGLDAGCGMGRHLYHSTKLGAEMIGLDFSAAVESARKNTQNLSRAHVVQADIHHLPFHRPDFDFCYSLGVLHHLPDPELGFKYVLDTVKPEGTMVVYVYKSFKGDHHLIHTMIQLGRYIRQITTKMPHKLLYWLCAIAAPVTYLVFVLPAKIFAVIRCTRELASKIPFAAYGQYPLGVLHNDLFDRFGTPIENRYTRQEVTAWFERAGLEDIRVEERGGWVVWGRKKPIEAG